MPIQFFKRASLLIGISLLAACTYSEGDWRATVGDRDEICSVYHYAQMAIMEERKVYDRDFPDRQSRRSHIKPRANGHYIESWFFDFLPNGDTLKVSFNCEVYLSSDPKIAYYVQNLRFTDSLYLKDEAHL